MINGHLKLALKPGEVHLWLFALDPASLDRPDWENLLSAEEMARSKRYISSEDRLLFTARRGILRQLLGQYCGMDAARICYHANPNGKLSLPNSPISFNLSKSQNRVACVFTLEEEAGVDIEQVRPKADLSSLAKQFFSADEQAGLRALPPQIQLEAFYHTWTQKEAFIKAWGMGLDFPLNDFSVSVDPAQPGALLSIKGSQEELSRWKMACITHEPGWRVAVCIRAKREIELVVYMPELDDFVTSASSGKMSPSV
jgi:4'-phosphopantetheinyl transferase